MQPWGCECGLTDQIRRTQAIASSVSVKLGMQVSGTRDPHPCPPCSSSQVPSGPRCSDTGKNEADPSAPHSSCCPASRSPGPTHSPSLAEAAALSMTAHGGYLTSGLGPPPANATGFCDICGLIPPLCPPSFICQIYSHFLSPSKEQKIQVLMTHSLMCI